MLTFLYTLEVIALVSVIVLLFRERSPSLCVLLALLVLILINEHPSGIPEKTIGLVGVMRVNVFLLLEFSLYQFYCYTILKTPKFRRWALIGLILFWVASLLNSLFYESFSGTFQLINFAVGFIMVLLLIVLYYYERLIVLQNLQKLGQSFEFWILSGLFLFLCTELPFMVILKYVYVTEKKLDFLNIFMNIKYVGSSIYYLAYPLGLLWKMKPYISR